VGIAHLCDHQCFRVIGVRDESAFFSNPKKQSPGKSMINLKGDFLGYSALSEATIHDAIDGTLPDDSENDNDNWVFAAYGAGQFLAGQGFDRARIQSSKSFARIMGFVINGVLFGLAVFLFVSCFQTQESSIWQSYYIEFFSGTIAFIAFPTVVRLGVRFGWLVYIVLAALSIIFAIFSSQTADVSQSLCIEMSVSFALLLGLDVIAQTWLRSAESMHKEAIENLRDHEIAVAEAKERLEGPPFTQP
ncbi:MAG: hypothetical protein AAF742_09995, partial [Pseudomonadota bacterium]